ncbi:MAG: type III ribulose-bisphosphate carboxylase [Candidatus Aenigmarchaeota archaeon]|nr:type III ribulose-bisphosphate carboxylase [Candidatus Aenigmarchaeota archaeon]MCX8190590.1 type III ribulose-bisphosphate carboxylase [Candidatus Aenigmarchaeota archaeon]MDW8160133.1 type III ribulose-bisphosphate carboxylase [Candidatus Aenigmarchaeota archaeon]
MKSKKNIGGCLRYEDFLDIGYKPSDDELVVLFRVEPNKGMSMKEVAARVASESSCGTWSDLKWYPKRVEKLKGKVFEIKGNFVKISYPLDLFELESIPNLLSGIAGNIFGMKAVKNLRLIDATFPKRFLKFYKGAFYGHDAISKIFKRKEGPIIASVPKPKVGFSHKEHAKVGYLLWRGGLDVIKDDENLSSPRFNKFEERVKLLAKYRDKVEKEVGGPKDAFINVTAPTLKEMERRIKMIHDYGFKYFMLDVVVAGFTAVQTATEIARDLKMAIHGHRAMHAMFTRNEKHGMSMLFLAKLMRILGVDQIHIGTVVGKLEGRKRDVIATKECITENSVNEIEGVRLKQEWYHIKPILPVASGGLHPGILPELFDIYKTTNIVIQVGGGIFAHPMGIEAGARAVVQAVEAYKKGISLEEYAEKHKELKKALEVWGKSKPV